jgi:hypothetical protein
MDERTYGHLLARVEQLEAVLLHSDVPLVRAVAEMEMALRPADSARRKLNALAPVLLPTEGAIDAAAAVAALRCWDEEADRLASLASDFAAELTRSPLTAPPPPMPLEDAADCCREGRAVVARAQALHRDVGALLDRYARQVELLNAHFLSISRSEEVLREA